MSARTFIVLLVGVAATTLTQTLVQMEVFDELTTLALSDFGSALIVAACACVIAWMAFRFAPRSTDRTVWLLIAAGVFAFAAGDVVWGYIEVIQGREVPYPGVPDIFYSLHILLVGPAVFLAGWSYRAASDVTGPLLIATVSSTALFAVVFVGFLWPYVILDTGVGLFETLFNVAYIATDIVVLMGAAVFTGLVTTSARLGARVHPWWVIVGAAIVLGLTDVGFAWITVVGEYEAGAIVDYGWLLSHVFMAVAASLARDAADAVDAGEA